jgi:hypothetical protein
MAKVDEQLLGKITGKIGKFVFRNVGGKTFVSVRPEKYNVKGTKDSTQVKKGFKNLVSFASFINSIEMLKYVWANKSVKGKRAYNKIISHNKMFIKSETINEDLLILPQSPGHKLFIFSINFEGNHILLEYIYDHNDYPSKGITHKVVFVFYSTKEKTFSYQLDELESVELGKRTVASFPVNKENLKLISSSKEFIIYSGIVALSSSGEVISWSNSVAITERK